MLSRDTEPRDRAMWTLSLRTNLTIFVSSRQSVGVLLLHFLEARCGRETDLSQEVEEVTHAVMTQCAVRPPPH